MEKREMLRNKAIWVVAAVVGLVLLPGVASSEDCSVQCSVSSPPPSYVNYVGNTHFEGSRTYTGNCCGLSAEWNFGDGNKNSPYSIDHMYVNPGNYNWTFAIWDSCYAQAPRCTRSGTVTIVPSNCSLSCAANVASVDEETLTVEFQGTASSTNCGGSLAIYYQWGWGDGDYSAITTSASASHTYKNPGTYWYTLYVRLGGPASGVLRSCSGSVQVGCTGITVGGLRFCADTVTQDQDRYTLSGNVRINNLLFFGQNVIFQGNPDSGQGTIQTNGNLYVKTAQTARGDRREIFAAGSYSFAVNGTNQTLLPNFVAGLTYFGFQVEGVPLAAKTWPIAFTPDGLRVDALLYVGLPGEDNRAALRVKFLFPPGGNERIVEDTEVVGGKVVVNLEYVKADITYDPVLDKLEGTLKFKFPKEMNLPDIQATIRVVKGCLNYVGLTVGIPSILSFGLMGWNVTALTFEVDGICVAPLSVFFGGNVYYGPVPKELFVVEHIGLKWRTNNLYSFEVQGGTAKILGYSMANLVGHLRFDEPFLWVQGNLSIADVLQGNANLGFVLQSFRVSGNGKLALRLPALPCSPTNMACRTMASWLKSRVNLPYTFAETNMDLKVRWDITTIPPIGYIDAQGMVYVGPIGLAALVQVGTDGIHVSIGNNYEDMISIAGSSKSIVSKSIVASATGAERTVVLNATQPAVMFSVLSDTALPSIYLKTPDGKTITPANVASFPGVTYVGDAEDRVALFEVLNAQAGTWIIGEDSLPPESVSFVALGPVPPPQTAFTSVTKTGDTVNISASVTPAGANTKVGFYYTKVLDGTVEGVIAEDLDAASGTVSAVWDTSKVPPGTYYLAARTEDGKNPPQIKVYDGSFSVNPAALAPPTGLMGTRDGETASLSWTASTSSGVIGYDLLYTDHPTEAGYPFSMTVPEGTSATVTDLDPVKLYRFCVVAFDGNGQYSSESNTVTFGVGIPGDCDMNGAVSVWEVQGAINMFLGTSSIGCGVDENGDGVVSIDEVQKVINQYLQGP